MEFRRKAVAGATVGLAILLVALASAGCGGSSSVTTTANIAASTTSSLASANPGELAAAQAYFAAMAPVIDKDYQGLQWFDQVMTQWQQTYQNSASTDRQAWNALGQIFQQAIPKEQEIIQGYAAITPPEAFRTAHAALIENNRDGNTWAASVVAAIKANRPTDELLSMLSAGPPGPSSSEVLAEFQDAAARVGTQLPTKLIDTYLDDSGSSEQRV